MIREYQLKDENGRWLAQVLISDDGMFSAVSEYGNFAYAWRSFGGDFRKFLLSIDNSYFADKMQTGMAYLLSNRKVATACQRFSGKILSVLKSAIRAEIKSQEELKDYDKSIHTNPDAEAWAKFYCECNPGADLDMMRGWFANAMMAMHDHIYNQLKKEPLPIEGWPKSCEVCMKTPEEDCSGCPNFKEKQ